MLRQFIITLLGLSLWAAESPLVYVKRDTREDTRRASIDATRKALTSLQQSPWHYLLPVSRHLRFACHRQRDDTGRSR